MLCGFPSHQLSMTAVSCLGSFQVLLQREKTLRRNPGDLSEIGGLFLHNIGSVVLRSSLFRWEVPWSWLWLLGRTEPWCIILRGYRSTFSSPPVESGHNSLPRDQAGLEKHRWLWWEEQLVCRDKVYWGKEIVGSKMIKWALIVHIPMPGGALPGKLEQTEMLLTLE